MKHPQRGIRPARLMALLAIPALLLSACATPQPEAGAAATGGVPLAQAGDAVLEDPRDFAGPSTATVVDAALDPVVDRADPTLPAVVTDAQGTQVTIEDTSRILALDIYYWRARSTSSASATVSSVATPPAQPRNSPICRWSRATVTTSTPRRSWRWSPA